MQLKIWHKMIIGISIPSFIALMGGVLTFGYINDVKNRENFVEIADDLKEQALEIRRNEKNFLYYKNSEHRDNFREAISVFILSTNSISSHSIKEIGKEVFLELNKTLESYSALIDRLYENYQHEIEITEKVRTEGRKLETSAEKGKHSKELSTNFILNLRRLEKNYMLFRDKKSFNELNMGLSQIKHIIHFGYDSTPYIEAISNLFTVYKTNDLMVNKLQDTGYKLEAATNKIAISERKKISSFLTLTQQLTFAVLVLLCVLGPLFVYKTATYIVTPIKRLADITKKISEGNINIRAPLKEQDETYSLALSFNTMLDHLMLTHQSLEQSVKLLSEKQDQLVESEKRAAIGYLVSGVAHELNNPLNNISLTSETMIEDLEGLDKDEIKTYIADIFAQSERAQHIVENLLDFTGARKSTTMEKQEIISLVKKSIELVANQLRVNKITLEQDIPESIFYVKGNRGKLEQIFINLIVNAIQAMENKGTLTISVKPDIENKNISIKISDTGKGIPEDDLKKIFEPFFTTKAVGKGTGLGLSVSKSLVMEHKGEIEIESKLDVGTTFTIKFPLYEESA